MATVNELKLYIELGKNILLQGPHGVGKTQMLLQACSELKHEDGSPYVVAYYSASTMDPYTDLVGIPVPDDYYIGGVKQDKKTLTNVRPHVIDDADVIFVDEFNRGEPKTLNGFFETIQFHTINRERLPKLKAFVAAQNPPDDDNYIGTAGLDKALEDRFQIYITMDAKPDRSYLNASLIKKGFDKKRVKEVVSAILTWYKDGLKNNQDYISPRRIEDIAQTFLQMEDMGTTYAQKQMAIEASMPPGSAWHHGELLALLAGDPTANPDNEDYDFSKAELTFIREKADMETMKKWYIKNPDKRETIIKAITSERPDKIGQRFAPILSVMNESEFKDMIAPWGESKARKAILKTTIEQQDDKILDQKTKDNLKTWLEA